MAVTATGTKQKINFKKLICIALAATGFVWIIIGIGDLMTLEKPHKDFISTNATIINSSIESSSIEKKDNINTTIFYNATITFQYTVDDQTYTRRGHIGQVRRNDPAEAQKIVESYKPGTNIKILYNPIIPGESRIETPYLLWPATVIGSGFMLILFSVVIFFFPVITVPKKKKAPATKNTVTESYEEKPVLSPELMQLQGSWSLLYQVPSMREIIAASKTSGSTANDTQAVISAGTESLTVIIGPSEIVFKYADSKSSGSCDVVSHFKCDENRLSLKHISMDFLIADVDGFPPESYIFDLGNPNKLTLTSDGISGLGGKQIVYIFKRTEQKE